MLHRFFLFIISFFFLSLSTQAQLYYSDTYKDITQKTFSYTDSLEMDVFFPKENKASDKPVVLYVHGGGFMIGKRDLPKHMDFCRQLAKKGYVAITMSYHLTMKGKSFGCDQLASKKAEAMLQASEEVAMATKYIVDHADSWGIDTSQIVLAGSSAGAEAVIHTTYCPESTEGILPHDFKYGGVISMAGALLNLNWINETSVIPTQLFHGTCDNLVPYADAPHHYCSADESGYMMLFGGYSIYQKLQQLNAPCYLVTGCGGGHEWNELPLKEQFRYVVDFLYHDVVQHEFRQIHVVEKSNNGATCAQNASYKFCE